MVSSKATGPGTCFKTPSETSPWSQNWLCRSQEAVVPDNIPVNHTTEKLSSLKILSLTQGPSQGLQLSIYRGESPFVALSLPKYVSHRIVGKNIPLPASCLLV